MDSRGITPLGKFGKKNARIKYFFVRETIGEFIGTIILMFMIVGSNAQFLMKNATTIESQVVPVFGTIFGIMIAMVVTGGVTGAHLNPALSLSLAMYGELSWYSVPGFLIGQISGAVVGSLLAWSIAHPMIRDQFLPSGSSLTIPEWDTENGLKIAGIFGPIREGFTVANGFSTEMMETCLLILIILAAIDKQSSFRPPKFLLSIMIPLAIAGLCFSHDLPSGTVMNPVRDLGPRIAAWILGWSSDAVFKSKDWDGNVQHWWLVGLFGPIIGGTIAVLIYSFLLGPQLNLDHLKEEDDYEEKETTKKGRTEILAASKPNDANGDWRNTVFVSKPQAPTAATLINGGGYNHANPNNNHQLQANFMNGNEYTNRPYQSSKGY